MSRILYSYLVGVLNNDGTVDFVTKVDNSTKTFICEKGEPAIKMSKTVADDLMYGMVLNCVQAAVIKVPVFYDIRNRGEVSSS